VQGYIDIYTHNREEMGRVIGLTKYYFPIYEKAFKDAGIPDEIKYLSIVESKLDPYAVSRVGATGLWQFMFTTGKIYGLNVNDYVDERRDPIQASYAAAAYIKDAYEEFGDWLLAIASYNCGTSGVEHAIEMAGTSDFWTIRQYLPVETRNYVPAFIAMTYVMNCYNKHGIVPQACDISLKTDTVLVNKYVALSDVSRALNIDLKQLIQLNPAYSRLIINGTAAAPRRLVIPEIDKAKYAALYDALNNSKIAATAPIPATGPRESYAVKAPMYHTVKRGETLSNIADTYGIDPEDLKSWNHLHNSKVVVGQRLRIRETAEADSVSAPSPKRSHARVTYKAKNGDTSGG
jgi:membrane-bound lytic murein transglycosylase D